MIFKSNYPDITIPEVSLPEFVLQRAKELADKPALIDGPSGRTLTYGQLAGAVSRAVPGRSGRRLSGGHGPAARGADGRLPARWTGGTVRARVQGPRRGRSPLARAVGDDGRRNAVGAEAGVPPEPASVAPDLRPVALDGGPGGGHARSRDRSSASRSRHGHTDAGVVQGHAWQWKWQWKGRSRT